MGIMWQENEWQRDFLEEKSAENEALSGSANIDSETYKPTNELKEKDNGEG